MRARVEQHIDRLAKEGARRGAEVGGRGLERGLRLGREAVTDEVVHHADAQAVDREPALLTVDALVIALSVVPAEDPEHGSDLLEAVERFPRARVAAVHDQIDARERVDDLLRLVAAFPRAAVVVREDADALHRFSPLRQLLHSVKYLLP